MHGHGEKILDDYMPLQGMVALFQQICIERFSQENCNFLIINEHVTCHNINIQTSNQIGFEPGDLNFTYVTCIPNIKRDLFQTIQEYLSKGGKILIWMSIIILN
jgi:hypothetical protein